MAVTIKYTGTQIRWPELAITGKQSVWNPGQIESREDAEAALLLATGVFTDEGDKPLMLSVGDGLTLGGQALTASQQAQGRGGFGVGNPLGTSLVIIGDSLGAQGYGLVGTSYRYRNHGWWCHALNILGWPLEVKNMAAVSSRTAQDILAGFDAEVTPHLPAWVFGIVGQNNLGDADGGAAAITAINGIAAKCKAIGAILLLGTVTPRSVGGMTATVKGNLININRNIRSLGQSGAAVVFDACAAMTDATSADGAVKTSLVIDEGAVSLHPNADGAAAIGQVAASVLAGKLPVYGATVTSNLDSRQINANSTQLLLNPKMVGTSGTANNGGSGVVATSYNLSRQTGSSLTVVGSKITETGPKGREWQRQAFSGTLSGIENTRLQQSVPVASLLAPVTPGTSTAKAVITLKQGSSAPTNLQYVAVVLECLNSVPADIGSAMGMADSGYKCGFFPVSESRIETPTIVVPVGTVTLRATLRVAFAAGAAGGEIDATDFEMVIG